MERLVSVKLTYTPDDSLRVARYIRNQSFVYRNDIFLTSGLVFVSFIILIVVMADDISALRVVGAAVFSAIPAIMTGIAVFVLHRLLTPWLMRRTIVQYFEASPTANEETLLKFSDEGICIKSDLVSSNIRWPAIVRVLESSTDILIYNGRKLGWFIPKSALASDDDLVLLRCQLKGSLKDSASLLDD